jgi:hypothetical protein
MANGTTVTSASDIYDFEPTIEAAAKRLIEYIDGFQAFTSLDVAVERPRPRWEIVFLLGMEAEHHEALEGELFANAWTGTLALQVIVDSDRLDVLRDWRARMRAAVAHWKTKLDEACPFYAINYVRSQGASPMFSPDKGIIACTLRYSILFSLLPGCLAELAAAESQQQP